MCTSAAALIDRKSGTSNLPCLPTASQVLSLPFETAALFRAPGQNFLSDVEKKVPLWCSVPRTPDSCGIRRSKEPGVGFAPTIAKARAPPLSEMTHAMPSF